MPRGGKPDKQDFAGEEKQKLADELVIANEEKEKRVAELVIANEEKAKHVAGTVIADEEKAKRVAELVIANEEKEKRVAELVIANEEKSKQLAGITIADEEKAKRVAELLVANEEKQKLADELVIANQENLKRVSDLAIANDEKAKRVAELLIANEEKQKLADELVIANEEKAKRVAELVIADSEKAKRVAELVIANEEKQKRVTELIIANEKLELLLQLNADKDLFLSILAHDLRGPFSGFLGLTDLLKRNIRKYDINEIENIISEINKAAKNTFALLEDLLKWARMQSGNFPFKPQVLNLKKICSDSNESLQIHADSKNISINCLVKDDTAVFADIDMLKAIYRNLVSNAIKFTKTGGRIDIDAEKGNKDVTITISDNGIGIKPDDLTKLFDISQIKTTTGTNKEPGTGLGLILCKEFIEKHRGKIWVESQYGRGSNFKFTMPDGS